MTEIERAIETIQKFAKTAEIRRSELIDLLSCDCDQVAYICGDTFLHDAKNMSSVEQWDKIITLLNREGYIIVRKDKLQEHRLAR